MIVESVSEGETEADAPAAQPNVLDAGALKPDESLAGRDLSARLRDRRPRRFDRDDRSQLEIRHTRI